jgi:ADP-ribose pyrophosphatase YjhB (NUDIX family)
MNIEDRMHKAQQNVLYALQYATRARYSELLRASDFASDSFKFHLQKLCQVGLVAKAEDGLYELTAEGKAYVSRLDRQSGRQIEQPKASMLMVVTAKDKTDWILAHQRTREPFNGFWGIASAPVLRGVPLAEAAARELKKQTGIEAEFTVKGFYRVIDKNSRGTILEDKIFAVVHAVVPERRKPHEWSGGMSEWMAIDILLNQTKLFPTTASLITMLDQGASFAESTYTYDNEQY